MKILKKLALLGCAMALLCAGAVASHADLIVDTGPEVGGTYTGGWTLWKDQWLAGQFSLSQVYIITQVQGLIGYNENSGGDIQTIIYTDANGLPGEKMQNQTFTSSNPGYNTWQGPSGLSWILPAGTYWLAFEVDTSSTFQGAMPSIAENPLDYYAYAHPPSFVYTEPSNPGQGFRVYGDLSPVPIPSTLLLLSSGLLGLGLLGQRRKKS